MPGQEFYLSPSMWQSWVPLALSCSAVLVGVLSLIKTWRDNLTLKQKLALYHESYGYYEIGRTLDTAHACWRSKIEGPQPSDLPDAFKDKQSLHKQRHAYLLMKADTDAERRKVVRWSKSLGSFWQSFITMHERKVLPEDVLLGNFPWVVREENYREFMEPWDMALHYLAQVKLQVKLGDAVERYERPAHYEKFEQAQAIRNKKHAADAQKALDAMTEAQRKEAEDREPWKYKAKETRFPEAVRTKLDDELFELAEKMIVEATAAG